MLFKTMIELGVSKYECEYEYERKYEYKQEYKRAGSLTIKGR